MVIVSALSRTLSLSCLRFFLLRSGFGRCCCCFFASSFWFISFIMSSLHLELFFRRSYRMKPKLVPFVLACSSVNWLFYLCAQKLLSILFWLIAIFLVLPLLRCCCRCLPFSTVIDEVGRPVQPFGLSMSYIRMPKRKTGNWNKEI